MKKHYNEAGEVVSLEAETEAERDEFMSHFGDYSEAEMRRARRQMAIEDGCVPIRPEGWIWGSSYYLAR